MGRMSQYLKQTATLERVKLASGKPVINVYGEPEYESAVVIKCRREKLIQDVQTSSGATVKSSAEYFTDVEIGINDKLDGAVVLLIEDYTNAVGQSEGFRSIV